MYSRPLLSKKKIDFSGGGGGGEGTAVHRLEEKGPRVSLFASSLEYRLRGSNMLIKVAGY